MSIPVLNSSSPRALTHSDAGRPPEGARWLTRGVLGIGLTSFLADAGHEIPTALLPGLLTSTLGAPAAALGLIEGLADGAAGVARFTGGALADDPDRRRVVAVGGYVSTAILAALVGITVAVWQAAVLRMTAWVSRGLRVPARDALLADLVPASVYGRAYGFERAMDNFGAIVGPALALVLVTLVGTRIAIVLSVIPGLLAGATIVYAIRQTTQSTVRKRQPVRVRVRPLLKGQLGRLILGVVAFELGHVAATLLILRATQIFEPGLGHEEATQVALALYIGYNVAATVASVPAGRLGDTWGAPVVLAGGIGCFFLGYLGFALSGPSLVIVGLSFLVAGVAIGSVETAQHAAVATLAPPDLRGSAFGLLAGVQAFANLAASGIAGLLWTLVDARVAFLYLAAWMLLALGGLAAAEIARQHVASSLGSR